MGRLGGPCVGNGISLISVTARSGPLSGGISATLEAVGRLYYMVCIARVVDQTSISMAVWVKRFRG